MKPFFFETGEDVVGIGSPYHVPPGNEQPPSSAFFTIDFFFSLLCQHSQTWPGVSLRERRLFDWDPSAKRERELQSQRLELTI
jgi:hypothetical protein